MNRLSDDDKNWKIFTLATWRHSISAQLCGGDDEDPENYLLFTGFGRALRIQIPVILKEGHEYSISLSKQGGQYDFLTICYGPQTWSSDTTKRWTKFLPWTQYDFVRTTLFAPDGSHFATHLQGDYDKTRESRDKCPQSYFKFADYDGEEIVAACRIEEREWRRGVVYFKWLRHFHPGIIRRCLEMTFDKESGPEKGSYKGGITGTSIDMLEGETPESAFRRYCGQTHKEKGRDYKVTFIGNTDKNEK